MAIYQQVGTNYRLYLGPVQGIDTWLWMAPGFSPLGGDTVMAGPMGAAVPMSEIVAEPAVTTAGKAAKSARV